MKTFYFPLICLGFLLLPVIPAQAAFNPAIVPGYARWVVYVDLNTLRDSALGKELIAAAEKAQLAQTDGKIGVDIQKLSATIGSITAYGANFAADPNTIDGALLVQGTPDLRKIAEAMLIQATITGRPPPTRSTLPPRYWVAFELVVLKRPFLSAPVSR